MPTQPLQCLGTCLAKIAQRIGRDDVADLESEIVLHKHRVVRDARLLLYGRASTSVIDTAIGCGGPTARIQVERDHGEALLKAFQRGRNSRSA
jgi:uncharacterized protein YejL (UPF0352 family)